MSERLAAPGSLKSQELKIRDIRVRAAALAQSAGMEMSSHLFPEVSAHLLAATPTCHWLEYVDWADAILAEPMRIVNGYAVVADRPGSGIEWSEEAVARYAV